jgi:hypothetical protein
MSILSLLAATIMDHGISSKTIKDDFQAVLGDTIIHSEMLPSLATVLEYCAYFWFGSVFVAVSLGIISNLTRKPEDASTSKMSTKQVVTYS